MAKLIRKVLFLTGTRADFGKLKPLVRAVEDDADFESEIFVTGMHVLARYGYTVQEIQNGGFQNIFAYMNQVAGESMDSILANTIDGLSRYVRENRPDLLVIHGDRVETLAGAIVGALNNILVAHVEGGEFSGTIDELIRHSVSKLSHVHFVANDHAALVLKQMGETENSVFVIGSPDIDVMLSNALPTLEESKQRYGINFESYAVALLHPVTTEVNTMPVQAEHFVNALLASGDNFVLIYPNNDEGADAIFRVFKPLEVNPRFRIFPSLRFEYFLTLLKSALYIVGNSSAGVREAPVYAVPTINVGTRQNNRFSGPSIINVASDEASIVDAIRRVSMMPRHPPSRHFGDGDSATRFMAALRSRRLWDLPRQKQFSVQISQ